MKPLPQGSWNSADAEKEGSALRQRMEEIHATL